MFSEIFKIFELLEIILWQIVAFLSKPKNPIFQPKFLKRPHRFLEKLVSISEPLWILVLENAIGFDGEFCWVITSLGPLV